MEMNCYPDIGSLSRGAAQFIVEWARECVALRERFTFVLSGGNTPKPLYKTLSSNQCRDLIPWGRTHIFWGDERCVPKDHPDSNYGMAHEFMLERIGIPPENVHRISGEMDPPESGAEAYEIYLRDFFRSISLNGSSLTSPPHGKNFPSFDLVLLGIGEDGHTASLFPGDAALEETSRWAVAVRKPRAKPPIPRITLTLPTINQAGCVLFLVSGKSKKPIMQAVMEDSGNSEAVLPASRVKPKGRLLWFYS